MRAIDPALQERLDSGATTLCACWLIERRDGRRLGFTDHDEDIAFDGVTFAAAAALQASESEAAAGLAPDQMEVVGALSDGAITAADIAAGRYDGATVRRWLVDWREPALRLIAFEGMIGAIEQRGSAFAAELLGRSALLNRPLGRAFLPTCDARLGDARCGVDLAAGGWTAEAVVAAAADRRLTLSGLEDRPAGWFARGRIAWLTGAAAGLEDAVGDDRTEDGLRVLTLWTSPAARIAPGDRARVEAGCDKRFETCRTRFGNAFNFRGFPHVPGDGWITGYPGPGEVHDGGPLVG